MDWRIKVAVALGAVLSLPVYRGWSDGTIPTSSAVIRVGVAMALAYAGVAVVAAVIRGYLPEPEPEAEAPEAPADGVEDAVLVEPGEPAAHPEQADAET